MTRIHWCDCAIYNGPAYPTGPCDCGMLDLAEDAGEDLIVSFVTPPGSFGLFVQNAVADGLIEKQDFPANGLVADTATSHLKHAHSSVIGSCDTCCVDLYDANVPIIANFKTAP